MVGGTNKGTFNTVLITRWLTDGRVNSSDSDAAPFGSFSPISLDFKICPATNKNHSQRSKMFLLNNLDMKMNILFCF